MDVNKLTVKSQEALAAAQGLARERNHAQIEEAHLLAALLGQTEGVVYPLLQRMEAHPRLIREAVEDRLEELPKVYGVSSPTRHIRCR